MSLRHAASGALGALFLLGCGERAGDPIVALPKDLGDAGQDAGGAGPLSAGGASGQSPDDEPGPLGLCRTCAGPGDTCGDANDVCVLHDSERFCGRDCDEQGGCPEGYTCVDLANSFLSQCVPQDSCAPASAAPALTDVRQYLLSRINGERAAIDRAPLVTSSCLDRLAQQSALDLARTDEPLGKYLTECDPVWPACECGWNAEAEVAIAGYGLDWSSALERALTQSPGSREYRFTQAYLASEFTDIGIGFWISGDEAWIALSFH